MDESMRKFFENDRLYMEAMRLYGECDDEGVMRYFDADSEKNLRKKIKVLKKLNDGESPEEIGDDYYEILEKLPDGDKGRGSW